MQGRYPAPRVLAFTEPQCSERYHSEYLGSMETMNTVQSIKRWTAFAAFAGLVACNNTSPDSMLASSKEYLAKGDRNAAIIQLKNALQQSPDLPEARFLLGKALLDSGDVPAAEKELRRAKELKYPAGVVDPPLAMAMVQLAQHEKVADEFQKSVGATPRDQAMLQTALAYSYGALGKHQLARDAVASAETADPTYLTAWLAATRIELGARRADLALAPAEHATQMAPESAEAWALKGEVLLAQNRLDDAEAAYRKAVELPGTYLPAYGALINLLTRHGPSPEVDKTLAAMKAAAPDDPRTLYAEALASMQGKRYEEARAAIQKYLRVLPDSIPGLMLQAAIDNELRSFSQAETALLKAMQQSPDNYPARRMLAITYARSGQSAKAVDTLKPIMDKIDSDPPMLSLAGQLYLQSGQPEKAARYFEKAAAKSEDAGPRTGLALAHMAQGETEQGLRELETTAANDAGTRADVALITSALSRRDYPRAMSAIDALQKKQPNSPVPHNLRGLALLGKGEKDSARKSFERAAAVDAAYFPAIANLARMDLAEGNAGAAQKRFETFLSAHPSDVAALLALAELRERERAPSAEVAAIIQKAISGNSRDPRPRVALVGHYLIANDPKQAMAAAQEAASAFPDRYEVVYALAQAQRAAGNRDQAMLSYRRAAELNPGAPEPYVRIAELETTAKSYDAAAQALQKALEIRPDLVEAQRGLAIVELARQRPGEAVRIAKNVQKQRPKESVGYLLEGDIYSNQKQWPQAITAYRAGVNASGASDAVIKLHAAQVVAGHGAEAEKTADSWLKSHPDDAPFKTYLAQAAGQRGDYASALRYYRSMLGKDPNNPVLLNNVAWVAGQMKDPQALEYAERANKLAPRQPAIMDTLGMLLVDAGQTKRGVELLEQAAALAPEAYGIRLNLARALIKADDKVAARRELDRLGQLGNKFPQQAEVERLKSKL